jgi:hypothetical protein
LWCDDGATRKLILEPGSIATPIWLKPAVADVPADDARTAAVQRDDGQALAGFRPSRLLRRNAGCRPIEHPKSSNAR